MINIQQYEEIQLIGIEAEQMVRGVLRGGYVFQGKFYYPAAVNVGIMCVDADNYKASAANHQPEITGAFGY